MRSHGEILPSYYYEADACGCCGTETVYLFDHDGDWMCGYCHEKKLEEEATEISMLEDIKEAANG